MKAWLCIVVLYLPLHHLHINSPSGYRKHPVYGKYRMHRGIDLRARHDTVFAILDGVVISAGPENGLGLHIRLQHGNIQSGYGHLSKIMVRINDTIRAGQPIGITGSTGCVTGEHLHFSLSYKGRLIDPIKFFYEFLIKNQNEQKLQSTARSAFGKADRGN